MIDDNKYIFRKAVPEDIDFLVTAILEAEKSSTSHTGLELLFGIPELKLSQYLKAILEEGVDGCEFSVGSFIVAEYEGVLVSTVGGWLEGHNDVGQSSAVLKSNLIQYHFPLDRLLYAQTQIEIVEGIQLEREWGAYQCEYAYTVPSHRGHHLVHRINQMHIIRAREQGAKRIQVHVFENNAQSLRAYERSGFTIVERKTSTHPLTKDYYPDNTICLLEREL